jgi:leucyl-tRNA synthetase
MADAGVLRLHAFLEWVKQILGVEWKVNKSVPGSPTKELKQFKKSELRRGNQTFADQIFCNEMNRLVALTSEHFEQTFYKEALKTGFFEFQVIVS